MNRKFSQPSGDEEITINKGIEKDPDTMVMSDEQFAAAAKPRRGRPPGTVAEVRKEQVTMRLDPDVLDALRATGPGWQSRVNEILRQAVRSKAEHKRRA